MVSDPLSSPDRAGGAASSAPAIAVPEVRDYQRINAELTRLLDAGHRRVRLAGVEGQRLLVSRLAGNWSAVVEVEGRAGPELAAELDAPGLVVVAHGLAADGAGRGLRAGLLVIWGDAGPAVGYAQTGGTIVVRGDAGPRAGLNQRGGDLILLGRVGPLAAERQAGGRVFAVAATLGPHAARGHRGGRLLPLAARDDLLRGLGSDDADALRAVLDRVAPWLDA